MTTAKKLGIWIDHSSAHLMEYKPDPIKTKIIASKFNHEDREQGLARSEKLMHKKERHFQAEYYKELAEEIEKYDDVILFGPTDAKVELLNLLRTNHRFAKINIEIQQTDKMTDNQQHAYVREYFLKR